MTAQVPMTLRGADKPGDAGNLVALAVRAGADKAKALVGLVGKDLTQNVYDLLPAAVSELVTNKAMLPTMNIVVSNVRGPDVPMCMAGAQMIAFAPASIAINGLGLNITGFSYHGTMWVCAVACREMMPDPGFFAQCLRASFAELAAAAKGEGARTSRPRAKPVAKQRWKNP